MLSGKHLICILLTLLLLTLLNNFKEEFQSYSYPWRNRRPWNWWRRWNYNPWWRRWWEPYERRCPVGCRFVGGEKGYSCPNPSLAYGDFACKYDFDCNSCNWGYDGVGRF
jgi:hypothetical protein